MRLHEAPNRASGQDHATQTELSCTYRARQFPPTPKAGPQRYPSYIISVPSVCKSPGAFQGQPAGAAAATPRRPSKTKGLGRGEGSGWGPQSTRPPFLRRPPDGLGHQNGPLVSTLIPNILRGGRQNAKKNPPARSGMERISYTLSGRS